MELSGRFSESLDSRKQDDFGAGVLRDSKR